MGGTEWVKCLDLNFKIRRQQNHRQHSENIVYETRTNAFVIIWELNIWLKFQMHCTLVSQQFYETYKHFRFTSIFQKILLTDISGPLHKINSSCGIFYRSDSYEYVMKYNCKNFLPKYRLTNCLMLRLLFRLYNFSMRSYLS